MKWVGLILAGPGQKYKTDIYSINQRIYSKSCWTLTWGIFRYFVSVNKWFFLKQGWPIRDSEIYFCGQILDQNFASNFLIFWWVFFSIFAIKWFKNSMCLAIFSNTAQGPFWVGQSCFFNRIIYITMLLHYWKWWFPKIIFKSFFIILNNSKVFSIIRFTKWYFAIGKLYIWKTSLKN